MTKAQSTSYSMHSIGERVSSKIRNRIRMPTLTMFIQHSMGSSSHNNQTRKTKKNNPNWKKEVKLSLFAYDMILYAKNPKDATKILLELIHEFRKVAGYKINIQKSVALLNTNNESSEKENKKTVSFIITSKRIKYLRVNLTKTVQDLYWKTIWH